MISDGSSDVRVRRPPLWSVGRWFWSIGAGLVVLAVGGCTSGGADNGAGVTSAPDTASVATAVVGSSEVSSVESTAPSAPSPSPSPSTPEEVAAVEAEAVYREAVVLRTRFNKESVRQAAERGGVVVLTPEWDERLRAVTVGQVYQGIAGEPSVLLNAFPDMVDQLGEPVVGRVVVDEVTLYDPPVVVDGREGVSGLVGLRG